MHAPVGTTSGSEVPIQELWNAAIKSHRNQDDNGAAKYARLILRQEPNHGAALALLALTQIKYGREPAAALDHARRAVEAAPSDPIAQCALGIACRNLGLLSQSIDQLRSAVKLDPNNRQILRELGMSLVASRVWNEGWSYYERRPTRPYANGYQKPDPQGIPEWHGEDLTDKTLVVLGENGHGDQIQSFRFVARLLELPLSRLLICVRPGLGRLFEHSLQYYQGGDRAKLLTDSRVKGVHYKIATDSLAHRFGADDKTLPGKMPYLFSPGTSGESRNNPFRVGIVWRGARSLTTNSVRSISLKEWVPLIRANADKRWISLQHDDYDEEERKILGELGLESPLRGSFDFYDTAKIVSDLDLVVSVDTSMAHLAGAMGKPVWLLNRASSEWRWGWKPNTSPWYPTMKIFNQESLFDWRTVLEEVGDTLSLHTKNRP